MGYTLQIVGQKGLNPTVAALIMSLESVIATISGWIAYKIGFLSTDQTLTPRQIAGCVIVFAAVIPVSYTHLYKSKNNEKQPDPSADSHHLGHGICLPEQGYGLHASVYV